MNWILICIIIGLVNLFLAYINLGRNILAIFNLGGAILCFVTVAVWKILPKRMLKKAMLNHGAVETACPHCNKMVPIYLDGATNCLDCKKQIGDPKVVGGQWIQAGPTSMRLESKFDIRPHEVVTMPPILIEMGKKKQDERKF